VYLNFHHIKTPNYHSHRGSKPPPLEICEEQNAKVLHSVACRVKVMDVTGDRRIEDVWFAPMLSILVPV